MSGHIAHIADTLSSCMRSLFALKTLKAHGMAISPLHTVFKATVLAKILYAAPAWFGFASYEDKLRLEAFLDKSRRFYYYDNNAPAVTDLAVALDKSLFDKIVTNPTHVLFPLLPARKSSAYSLRSRPDMFSVPSKQSALYNRNFLMRMLYLRSYQQFVNCYSF